MRVPGQRTSWIAVTVVVALVAAAAILGVRGAPRTSLKRADTNKTTRVAHLPKTSISATIAASDGGPSAASDLLAAAVLPPDASPLAAAPTAHLRVGSSMTLPIGDQFNAHRFLTVPMGPSTIVGFVIQHLPPGWDASGPQELPPPGDAMLFVGVPGNGTHFQVGAVGYEAAPSGSGAGGADLRVDAVVTWNPSRPVDERVPTTGSVLVTGYKPPRSLLTGPRGPVTVRVTGRQASKLRCAFDALPLITPIGCMESATAYALRFVPANRSTPVVRAVELTCQGSVSFTAAGTRMARLLGDCAFLRLVASALPPHEAAYTHDQAARCEPRMPWRD